MQQCNNFKDPGVQHYGGALFRTLRDQIDDLFLKLPAPKRVVHGFPGEPQPVQQRANMRVYHNSSAPCFAGSSLALMADGTLQRVDELRKGQRVSVPGDGSAEVVCVIKTRCPTGHAELVSLPGGLLITAYHPVRVDGRWRFPCELAKAELRECSAVYSFVLSSGHVMLINGVECVSMGHGFSEDVVRHPYFGSAAIIADLARLPGWSNGCVEFSRGGMIRDPDTQLVNGLVYC